MIRTMKRVPVFSLLLAILVGLTPSVSSAQSLERSIERLVESITANAERLALRFERHANEFAREFEKEFNGKDYKYDHKYDYKYDHKYDRRDDWDWGERVLQNQATRIDTTVAFATDGIVDLRAFSGDIVVTGWDRSEARVRATVERGRMDFEITRSRITIEQRSERGRLARSSSSDTRYELSVPRGVRVMMRSNSGDVTITGTSGDVSANSNSGDVTIEGASGRIEAGSLSGEVRMTKVAGNVQATSVSGSLEVDGVQGDLRLNTTSGDVFVSNAQTRDVELSTSNGDIEFGGTLEASGRYEFSSHSGDIDLQLPATLNARITVGTYSGEVDSDFPITLQPGQSTSRSNRRFEFTVGNGGPRIIAETFSGDVTLRKR